MILRVISWIIWTNILVVSLDTLCQLPSPVFLRWFFQKKKSVLLKGGLFYSEMLRHVTELNKLLGLKSYTCDKFSVFHGRQRRMKLKKALLSFMLRGPDGWQKHFVQDLSRLVSLFLSFLSVLSHLDEIQISKHQHFIILVTQRCTHFNLNFRF